MKCYYIKWMRCTGETGRFSTNYFDKSKAERALRTLRSIDKDEKVYKYEIIEIGNSAK